MPLYGCLFNQTPHYYGAYGIISRPGEYGKIVYMCTVKCQGRLQNGKDCPGAHKCSRTGNDLPACNLGVTATLGDLYQRHYCYVIYLIFGYDTLKTSGHFWELPICYVPLVFRLLKWIIFNPSNPRNFVPHFKLDVTTYPYWDLSQSMLVKGVPDNEFNSRVKHAS